MSMLVLRSASRKLATKRFQRAPHGELTVQSYGFERYRDGVVRLVEKSDTATGGETFRPKKFFCFSSIAIGGLGSVAPTIRSRSIRLRMKPAAADRAPVRLVEHVRQVASLADKVGPHLAAHAAAICAILERGPAASLPPDLINRDADVWAPLFAVAELVGGEWPDRCAAACRMLGRPRRATGSSDLRDLLDAMQAFQAQRAANYAVGRASTATFGMPGSDPASFDPLVPLKKMPSTRFHEWLATSDAGEFAASSAGKGGKPLTQSKIASMLAEVDVFSQPFEVTRQGQRRQLQVFELEDLERVWSEKRS